MLGAFFIVRTALVQLFLIVPGERIELSWITPRDFESRASTNSAIPAIGAVYGKIPENSTLSHGPAVLE